LSHEHAVICQISITCLAALVPKPRVNLTRFHGVFAPNSKRRVDVTPAKRGKGRSHKENEDAPPEQRRQSMTWAQRLKRVFNIDLSICEKCGGEAKIIARGPVGDRQDPSVLTGERPIRRTPRVVAGSSGFFGFVKFGQILSTRREGCVCGGTGQGSLLHGAQRCGIARYSKELQRRPVPPQACHSRCSVAHQVL
jgi:hypothetical protein